MSNVVEQSRVQELIDNAKFEQTVLHGQVYVLSCKLPTGYVITESTTCIDIANFDEEVGKEICINKIVDKIWELEGYLVKN